MNETLTQKKEQPHLPIQATEAKEQIFTDGTHYFDTLLKDISQAKNTIDLETYIFQKDHLGQRIATELAKAAERGVQVRVLVDGAGSPAWSTSYAKMLETAGAITRVFHPFPWHLWNWGRSVVNKKSLNKLIYLLLKINFRNHRKVCVIDKHIAYIGSFNISKCHLHTSQGGDNWRDTAIRLSNIELSELEKAFEYAWTHHTIKERLKETFRHIRRDPIFRLNFTRHRRRILHKHLLRKIAQCKKRIWITNAYFVPDNFLLKSLKDAAQSGIDVRILLPKKSDVMMMPWASSTFYFSLLKSGVRIFEYFPSILHAKVLILDEQALIGSSNLNHRSLLHDLEVDVNVTSTVAKQTLEDSFLNDLKLSKEISLDVWKTWRPKRQRIMGRLVLYLKYWI